MDTNRKLTAPTWESQRRAKRTEGWGLEAVLAKCVVSVPYMTDYHHIYLYIYIYISPFYAHIYQEICG